jgi:hypothetical protein
VEWTGTLVDATAEYEDEILDNYGLFVSGTHYRKHGRREGIGHVVTCNGKDANTFERPGKD